MCEGTQPLSVGQVFRRLNTCARPRCLQTKVLVSAALATQIMEKGSRVLCNRQLVFPSRANAQHSHGESRQLQRGQVYGCSLRKLCNSARGPYVFVSSCFDLRGRKTTVHVTLLYFSAPLGVLTHTLPTFPARRSSFCRTSTQRSPHLLIVSCNDTLLIRVRVLLR